VIAVGLGEDVSIPCRVSASPTNLQFQWFFNSSDNKEFIDLPPSQFSVSRTTSLLQFSLHSERDYGTIQCRAVNEIGHQLQPCLVKLLPRDTPNRPQQCQARDLGAASVVVECLDLNILNTLGHVFVLELYQDSQLTQLVHNSSNSVPRWTLERLGPGKIYTARIYVSHVTGRSHPVIIKVATHKESSRFLILPPEDDLEHRDFPEEREREGMG